MFVLLEMIDVEPLDVRLFTKQGDAMAAFTACCLDGEVFPWAPEDLDGEMGGTLAIAGDDTYSVQLIEREEESIAVEGQPLKLLQEETE